MNTINVTMVPVKSSNVIAVGYKSNKMYVEFASGHYEYDDVPKEVYDGFSRNIFISKLSISITPYGTW